MQYGGVDVEVATGHVDGVPWVMRWSGALLLTSGRRLHVGDVFGVVRRRVGEQLAFTVDLVAGRPVLWGLVDSAAVAVRVDGSRTAPTIGPDLDGSLAFVVALPAGSEPTAIEAIGRDGLVLAREAAVPEPEALTEIAERIEVRVGGDGAGHADGTVVASGRVDDMEWEYGITVGPTEVQTSFHTWHQGGFGGGGSSSGPHPPADASQPVRIDGWGASGAAWHLTGWALPEVNHLVVQLRSGERVTVPTAGRDLGLAAAPFAVAFPDDAVAVVVDAYEVAGTRVARVHLRGRLHGLEDTMAAHRERRAQASGPVPAEVRVLWERILGESLHDEAPMGTVQVVRQWANPDQWPVRPLLVPATPGRWAVHGERYRSESAQGAGFQLTWVGGTNVSEDPDPTDWARLLEVGAVLLHEGIGWNAPPGMREDPTTTVRGRPAVLWEHTQAANNIDQIRLSWYEPTTSAIAPLDGVWCDVAVDPRYMDLDRLRRFAEALQVIE